MTDETPKPEPRSLDAHYADMAIQPTEFSMRNGLDPCQHTIIKYVSRYRSKHAGVRDLLAAYEYLAQYIHLETSGDWLSQDQIRARAETFDNDVGAFLAAEAEDSALGGLWSYLDEPGPDPVPVDMTPGAPLLTGFDPGIEFEQDTPPKPDGAELDGGRS